MLQRPPAEPGMSLSDVDTPALIVDLNAFEANLAKMAAIATAAGVKLRPHAKTHKSPVIALMQMAHGAVGQCVQKVAEAEILAWGGVPDILVSNEVVSPRKLARLAALARTCRIAICVDSLEGVDLIEAAARDANVTLSVLVEIDVGAGRCGIAPSAAIACAKRIAASPHLSFGGLQAYQGRAQHLRTPDERSAAISHVAEITRGVVADLRATGLECAIVGGAGTGTFALEAASGVFTELQVGSYIFMDADYGRNQPAPPFANALFVLSSVMSVPNAGLAIVDAGLKALAVDSGMPLVWNRAGIDYVGASDEHGNLALSADAVPLRLGEQVMLVPGHCDPTVDRYDWYVGIRGTRVERLWPVAARGAMT
jgi:D-serine deaminase-like pyridoxal phosphate-dependent protein